MILIDNISNVSLINGILRVECTSVGKDGQPKPSGEILIPANRANVVLKVLANALKQIQAQRNERAKAGNGDGPAEASEFKFD